MCRIHIVSNYEFWPSNILGKRAMQLVRDHLSRRQERKKSRAASKQICYGKRTSEKKKKVKTIIN